MKKAGIVLAALGAALATYAMFIFDPSVAVTSYGPYGGGRVVNMDLQQRQMMMAMFGAAMFVGGVVLYGISHLTPKAASSVEIKADAGPAVKASASYSESELQELGIKHDGTRYEYGGTAYSELADAVNIARLESMRRKLGRAG